MKTMTKSRKIKNFKKDVERSFGIKWFNVEFEQFKRLSNEKLDEFLDLLREKLEDANSWGRYVKSVYWSEREEELGIGFYEHGDYSNQFMKTVTFSALKGGEIKTFAEFVIKGIRKGLFIDTSDLYL